MLLAAAIGFTTSAARGQSFDDVTFDCTGSLTGVVETPEGLRATGKVSLTVDLPGGEYRSAGLIVLELPDSAAEQDLSGARISRCFGRGSVSILPAGNVQGVDIFSVQLMPSQVRLGVAGQRITDPGKVEFASQAGGSPNV